MSTPTWSGRAIITALTISVVALTISAYFQYIQMQRLIGVNEALPGIISRQEFRVSLLEWDVGRLTGKIKVLDCRTCHDMERHPRGDELKNPRGDEPKNQEMGGGL